MGITAGRLPSELPVSKMGASTSKKQEGKESTPMSGSDGRGRHTSGGSRGRHTSGGSGYGSVRFQDGQPEKYVRRLSSTATSPGPFMRQLSRRSSSGVTESSTDKTLASIRTRLTSISVSEYHQDLKPDLSAPLNVNLLLGAFIIVFGSSFQFGYNIGVLNQPVELIKMFYNKTYSERDGEPVSETKITLLWSLTNALFIPGGMFGAFLGGYLADKIGRKRTILLSHVFAFSGAALSAACVAAKAPELLMLGRVLVGVNSGLGNCIAPMFLSEIAPFNLRGAFGTTHQLFVTIGIFLSSVFGLEQILGTAMLWPFLILLEAIPAAVSLVVLPFLPETPRYMLLIKKDRDAARKSMEFYRRSKEVEAHIEEMDTETQAMAQKDTGEAFRVTQLFEKTLLLPLLIACSLQIIQQFSGINAIFFYSTKIFDSAGVPESQIPYAVIGTNAVNVIMTIISVPLMDVAGRRMLLLIPMVGMIIDLAVITVSLHLQAQVEWMGYVSVVCVIVYVICFAVGLGPIPMMIGAEFFRQGPRPYAMAAAGVVNWIGTFIIAMAFESIQMGLENNTFLLFLGLMVLFLIFTYFLVPETKGKTFEEIASVWAPGGELEVEEVVDDDDDNVFPVLDGDGGDDDHQLVTLNFSGAKSPDADDAPAPIGDNKRPSASDKQLVEETAAEKQGLLSKTAKSDSNVTC